MRFALVLLGILLVLAAVLAIAPHNRKDWALENALALLAVIVLVASARKLPLSKVSYSSIFLLMVLHEVGAHYTYSEVPYDAWFESATGSTLSALLHFERNHYDRLVHFVYGFLIFYPIREFVVRVADVRGFWGYFFPLDLVLSTSMMYELVEWGAAVVVGGDLGQAYLGTQGDVWDAQKDMALAGLGAILAALVTARIHRSLDRDFHREWAASLKVKRAEPLEPDQVDRRGRTRSA